MVPVDFTANNRPALSAAAKLASLGPARLWLVHVVEPLSGSSVLLKAFHRSLMARAVRKMEFMAAPLRRGGLHVAPIVTMGRRAPTIVRLAMTHRIDLLILGSHRIDLEHPSSDWASVSYKVAVLSQCPVLLVK